MKTSFLNLKLHTIRLAQGHWSCTPTHLLFVDGKFMDLMPKYYLLAGDASQFSILFFLHKIKMSKQHRFII